MKKLVIVLLCMTILTGLLLFYVTTLWTETPYEGSGNVLIIEGELITDAEEPFIENGNILLSFKTIKKYFDPNAFWDDKLEKAVFTTKDKLITMNTDKLTAMVNQKPVDLNVPVRMVEGVPYIPIEFLADMLGIKVELASDKIVVVDYMKDKVLIGEFLKNKGLKARNTIFSPYIKKHVKEGEKVLVFGQEGQWYKVRTKDGIIGYIQAKHLKVREEDIDQPLPQEPVIEPFKPENGKINMVWEHVIKKNPDVNELEIMEGLDIVSPTWFAVVDGEGNVENNADINYVNWAHENGYKVWGLASNSFNPDITHQFLNNTDTRLKIMQQFLIYAKLYKLDGINIDFENIYIKDRDMLTQFMREFYPLCREQGLTLSIDVTFLSASSNWSKCYDRKALAETVDYVVVMAYDQHWATSPKAGSVAQYEWVEKNLIRILEQVPPEKVILGMPFYTRLWKETKVDGKLKVTSKALSMESVQKILKEKEPEIIWDEASGQYYAQYTEDGATYKVWIEDAKSINLKSSLVHKYDLAGAAAWRRGFETKDIWAVIAHNLKKTKDYSQWAQANNK